MPELNLPYLAEMKQLLEHLNWFTQKANSYYWKKEDIAEMGIKSHKIVEYIRKFDLKIIPKAHQIRHYNSKSIWPIIAYINELPLNLRFEFYFVLTLYAVSKKPDTVAMFEVVIQELLSFDVKPLEIKIGNTVQKFYVRLLLLIADAPAQADVLKTKQFNSKYECNWCIIPSQYRDGASRYLLEDSYPLRTV